MPDAPLFTIVVATFDRGRHLVPTIASALGQSFADFELLVVGDGVTDDTLDQVPRGDPRVAVVALARNSGSQAAPNNAGIAAARGRYLAYLGHDDIWMPDHLAALGERFAATGCDVAVSGCAYHGPPGTELVMVTGLFESSEAARRHFFPPTSLAHRTSLAAEIGGWRAPDAITAPVDADFLLRAADAGARFVSTGRTTAHKFAAGHRYLSYLEQSSAEQCRMLAAIWCGDVDRRACAAYVARAEAAGTLMTMVYPDFAALRPGMHYRQNRSNKGLDRAEAVPLTAEVHLPQTMEPRALDWYPGEAPAGAPPFRWSGPSLRPKLLIPFTGDVAARITLHLADHDPLGVIDGIRLALNGGAIDHETSRARPGRVDLTLGGRLRPDRPSVLELVLPRFYCPAEHGHSEDRRRLGVILTGFTIAPVAAPS